MMKAEKWVWRTVFNLAAGLLVWHAAAPEAWGWLTAGQLWWLIGTMALAMSFAWPRSRASLMKARDLIDRKLEALDEKEARR